MLPVTNDGQPDPDETQPFVSPSGPEQPGQSQPPTPEWPSYAPPPAGPPTPPPSTPPYGAPEPPTYGQPPAQPPYGQNPYLQQPPPAPYGARQFAGYGAPVPGYSYAQSHGRATTSMVLGIVALVGILATPFCCITLPAMFAGPFAIWTGASAKSQIDQNPAAYNNRGQAVAGFIMGIVASVLAVLIIIVIVVFIGATDWSDSTSYSDY
jgi:hypothetical protein